MSRAAKGDGSAFKTPTGWRGYVLVNGRRKYFTAKTKAEAAQKRRELLNRRDNGTLVAGRSPTVGAWVNHWEDNVAKHRPTTHATNRYIIEQKIMPELGSIPLEKLTAERLEQWVTDLGVAPSSQKRYLEPLQAALSVAVKRGHIPFNPALRVQLVAQQKPNTTSFSTADRDAILAATTGYNRARWHLALRLGLRPAEALGLTWHDFDTDAGTLTIRHQLLYAKGTGTYLQSAPKTAAGERVIYLPRTIIGMLDEQRRAQLDLMAREGTGWVGWEYNGHPVALIFTQDDGRPIGKRMDTNRWKALLAAAGLPETRRYQARHTAASHLIGESGGDVAVAAHTLGHIDAGFTYRTYVHPLEERKRELAERMDAPYGAPYDTVNGRDQAEHESVDASKSAEKRR